MCFLNNGCNIYREVWLADKVQHRGLEATRVSPLVDPPVSSEVIFDRTMSFVGFVQFMQRGLDAETKQQLEEDHKRIISDEHWYLDLPELKAKE